MTVGGLLGTAGCGGSVTPRPGVISVVNSPELSDKVSSAPDKPKVSASAGLPLTTQGLEP